MNNNQLTSLAKAQFNQFTPENSMKWDAIESSQNNFNFNNGNQVVSFAQSIGAYVRGMYMSLNLSIIYAKIRVPRSYLR